MSANFDRLWSLIGERVAVIAWDGDIMQGFYVVPASQAERFLARYGEAHWKVISGRLGPAWILDNLGESKP